MACIEEIIAFTINFMEEILDITPKNVYTASNLKVDLVSLRSFDTAVYTKPRCRTKFGERGFSHAGPTAWNSLPHHLHHISDTGLFKRRLKTELFRRAYDMSLVIVSAPGRSLNSAIEMTIRC